MLYARSIAQTIKRSGVAIALTAALLCVIPTSASAADTEKVLASFSGSDGATPQSGLIFDAHGNLYGTTETGGLANCQSLGSCGTVFRLSPVANGTWHKKVLHRFTGSDGEYPMAKLLLDAAGNLYGTTSFGANNSCAIGASIGCGAVFELSPGANDTWTLKVLHRFIGTDGANPASSLVFDKAGNLYGTTNTGGTNNAGTVFRLRPAKNGAWGINVLHSFTGSDGSGPSGTLLLDSAGNLFGTTTTGGASNTGTVFELSPSGATWSETVLYSFLSTGGTQPTQGVVMDASGNVYGTTSSSADGCGCGTVFELTPASGGGWTKTTLHTFNSTDGRAPLGLVLDKAGNLYGLTFVGGSANDGVVFELSPGSGGTWTETQLHNFGGADGAGPVGALIFDANGNLYGASAYGGAGNNKGTVFEVTPAAD